MSHSQPIGRPRADDARRAWQRAELGRHRASVLRLSRFHRRSRRRAGEVRLRARAPPGAAFRQPQSRHEGRGAARHPEDHQAVARPRAQAARSTRATWCRRRAPTIAASACSTSRRRARRWRMKLAGLQTARIARALAELGPDAHEAAAPVPGRHDQSRPPRRRAAVHRARRPRAAAARLRPPPMPAMTPALPRFPTTRRICWWSTTTAASATCCRASCSPKAIASPRRRPPPTRAPSSKACASICSILDVMMPGETGFELARDLRASSSVPILMLTARDEAAEPHRGALARRRRLCRQAVRADASCRCASPISSSARARPRAPPVEIGALRRFPLPPRARRAQARRRGRPSHRPRARHAAAAGGDARRNGAAAGARRQRRRRPASAPSTCRSTACAARSSAIPPIRCWCRRCAGSATGW